MQVDEAVRARRAIKWYDAEHQMPEQTFRTLMEHAILAPTAFNIQNWRFVRVTDPEQRKAIRAVAWDQAQVTDLERCLDAVDERAVEAQLEGTAAGLDPIGAVADRHRQDGLRSVTGEHYEGGHWLGSFATYLVTERGLATLSEQQAEGKKK